MPTDPVRKALRDLVLAQRAIVHELRVANKISRELLAVHRAEMPSAEQLEEVGMAFAAGIARDAKLRGAAIPDRAPTVEVRDNTARP